MAKIFRITKTSKSKDEGKKKGSTKTGSYLRKLSNSDIEPKFFSDPKNANLVDESQRLNSISKQIRRNLKGGVVGLIHGNIPAKFAPQDILLSASSSKSLLNQASVLLTTFQSGLTEGTTPPITVLQAMSKDMLKAGKAAAKQAASLENQIKEGSKSQSFGPQAVQDARALAAHLREDFANVNASLENAISAAREVYGTHSSAAEKADAQARVASSLKKIGVVASDMKKGAAGATQSRQTGIAQGRDDATSEVNRYAALSKLAADLTSYSRELKDRVNAMPPNSEHKAFYQQSAEELSKTFDSMCKDINKTKAEMLRKNAHLSDTESIVKDVQPNSLLQAKKTGNMDTLIYSGTDQTRELSSNLALGHLNTLIGKGIPTKAADIEKFSKAIAANVVIMDAAVQQTSLSGEAQHQANVSKNLRSMFTQPESQKDAGSATPRIFARYSKAEGPAQRSPNPMYYDASEQPRSVSTPTQTRYRDESIQSNASPVAKPRSVSTPTQTHYRGEESIQKSASLPPVAQPRSSSVLTQTSQSSQRPAPGGFTMRAASSALKPPGHGRVKQMKERYEAIDKAAAPEKRSQSFVSRNPSQVGRGSWQQAVGDKRSQSDIGPRR